jgi:uncharacterized membrane protein
VTLKVKHSFGYLPIAVWHSRKAIKAVVGNIIQVRKPETCPITVRDTKLKNMADISLTQFIGYEVPQLFTSREMPVVGALSTRGAFL